MERIRVDCLLHEDDDPRNVLGALITGINLGERCCDKMIIGRSQLSFTLEPIVAEAACEVNVPR